VCSDTPRSRASSADSRIRSRETENGEQGASTMRRIEWREASCQRPMRRSLSRNIAASVSTTSSGGRPPALRPTLMLPRAA
jgi:hypothetical protein